eukprot:scaffold990_cov279-Pinguiococcus_pyrenoidosus.AAC.2
MRENRAAQVCQKKACIEALASPRANHEFCLVVRGPTSTCVRSPISISCSLVVLPIRDSARGGKLARSARGSTPSCSISRSQPRGDEDNGSCKKELSRGLCLIHPLHYNTRKARLIAQATDELRTLTNWLKEGAPNG